MSFRKSLERKRNTFVVFFLQDISLFCGATDIPVLGPTFKSQCEFLAYMVHLLYPVDSSDSPLVRYLLTYWWPAWQLSLFVPSYFYTMCGVKASAQTVRAWLKLTYAIVTMKECLTISCPCKSLPLSVPPSADRDAMFGTDGNSRAFYHLRLTSHVPDSGNSTHTVCFTTVAPSFNCKTDLSIGTGSRLQRSTKSGRNCERSNRPSSAEIRTFVTWGMWPSVRARRLSVLRPQTGRCSGPPGTPPSSPPSYYQRPRFWNSIKVCINVSLLQNSSTTLGPAYSE